MSSHTRTDFCCDRCGRDLPSANMLNIVTSIFEGNSWNRLHVTIKHHHGMNNGAKTEPANLCKNCTVILLEDAVKRVRAGERASEGTEEIEKSGWQEN